MTLSEKGKLLLHIFEGGVAYCYKDTAGKKTIGFGHLINEYDYVKDANGNYFVNKWIGLTGIKLKTRLDMMTRTGTKLTKEECNKLFDYDIGLLKDVITTSEINEYNKYYSQKNFKYPAPGRDYVSVVSNLLSKYKLSQEQFDSLVSVAYNCGMAGLSRTDAYNTATSPMDLGRLFLEVRTRPELTTRRTKEYLVYMYSNHDILSPLEESQIQWRG